MLGDLVSHFTDKHTEARFMAVLYQQIIKQRFKLAVISAPCNQKRSQLIHQAHEIPLTNMLLYQLKQRYTPMLHNLFIRYDSDIH